MKAGRHVLFGIGGGENGRIFIGSVRGLRGVCGGGGKRGRGPTGAVRQSGDRGNYAGTGAV